MDETANIKKSIKVSIIVYCFLSCLNIAAGLFFNSSTLFSEGFHIFADILILTVSYAGFIISRKPANEDYAFGHGHADTIARIAIAIIIFFISYSIITENLHNILNANVIAPPSRVVIVIALLCIFIRYVLGKYIDRFDFNIHSPVIKKALKYEKTDVVSIICYLAGVFISIMGFPVVDCLAGLVIGIIILKQGYYIAVEGIQNIMGKTQSDLVAQIWDVAANVSGVGRVTNIKVYDLGAYAIATFHIEIDGDISAKEAQNIVLNVEKRILEEISFIKQVTIQVDSQDVYYDHQQPIDV